MVSYCNPYSDDAIFLILFGEYDRFTITLNKNRIVKKIILLPLLTVILFSCSNDDESECQCQIFEELNPNYLIPKCEVVPMERDTEEYYEYMEKLKSLISKKQLQAYDAKCRNGNYD